MPLNVGFCRRNPKPIHVLLNELQVLALACSRLKGNWAFVTAVFGAKFRSQPVAQPVDNESGTIYEHYGQTFAFPRLKVRHAFSGNSLRNFLDIQKTSVPASRRLHCLERHNGLTLNRERRESQLTKNRKRYARLVGCNVVILIEASP
jgi:hypothetical protein